MTASFDDIARCGRYADAVKAWRNGDPSALYTYIEEHGIAPGAEAKQVADLIQNPVKPGRMDATTADIIRLTQLAILSFDAKPHGRRTLDEIFDYVADQLGTDFEIVKRYWNRYRKIARRK